MKRMLRRLVCWLVGHDGNVWAGVTTYCHRCGEVMR